jgi:hypothetical protein
MQHSGIAQSNIHAETFTAGTVSPWVVFVISKLSQKERIKTTIVTNNGLLKLDFQDFPDNEIIGISRQCT